jgi:lipopolysaccharide export system protein LptA
MVQEKDLPPEKAFRHLQTARIGYLCSMNGSMSKRSMFREAERRPWRYPRYLAFLVLTLLGTHPLSGQRLGSEISIHSENNQVIDATTEPATQFLNGDVKVFHEGTFMYCDTAVLRGANLRMYGNVVLIQHDTIRIFADSLHYNGDSLVAYLFGNIILENGATKKLYTTYLRYDAETKIGSYTQNARLQDGPSSLVSRRGRYLLNEKKAYFYENVLVKGDDFQLVTDSLAYTTSSQRANFLAPVRIDRDSSSLYSEQGWFDLDNKKGDFIRQAEFREGTTIAKADTIHYDGALDVVILRSDSVQSAYFTSRDTAFAKYIFYDRKNDKYVLEGQASFTAPDNAVKGDKVTYDKKSGEMHVAGRSVVSDPPFIIAADTLDYSKTNKYGKADGHVVWRDTAARTAIIADHVVYKGDSQYMKAHNQTGRPLFVSEIDADTLFMRADTLRSYRRIQPKKIVMQRKSSVQDTLTGLGSMDSLAIGQDDLAAPAADTSTFGMSETMANAAMDTLDFFAGEGNVRIFKSDMQAICDTFLFHKKDSLFQLRGLPFVWSDSSQIAGDTIDLGMKNNKINRLIVRSQATVVSTEDDLFYDQIGGRRIEASFSEGKLSRMNVKGNAQLVYYLRDDEKAYIGVNTTEASAMTFFLEDNKVKEIRNFNQPVSKVLPMAKTDHEALKLKGFQWQWNKRPGSSNSL